MDILEIVGDKKKIEVLKQIANSDSEIISIREISRKSKLPVSTVYRIFKELESKNVLKSKEVGGKKIYFIGEVDLSMFKKDPIEKYVEIVKEYVKEIRLVNRSSKGANLVVITDDITNFKKAEAKFNNKFKIQTIVLNEEQFQRLKQMGMVKEGEIIFKS